MEARELLKENGKKTIADDNYTNALVRKYGPWLKGIQDKGTQRVTAMLMENQMDSLKDLQEDTLTTNAGNYTKYIFPILRRVFPNLKLNKIASVQPMNASYGAVFNLEYRYQDRKGTKNPIQGSIANDKNDINYDGELSANDELNKNFGVYYASEYNDYDVICTDGAGNASFTESTNNGRIPAFLPMRAPGTAGQRTFSVKIYGTITTGTLDRTLTAAADGTLTDQDANDCGTINFTTGAMTVEARTAAGVADTWLTGQVIYAEYTYNSELVADTSNAKVQALNLYLNMQTIQAEPYRLKAGWSMDAMQDLRHTHAIDAEAELVSAISNEIAIEIDQKGIGEMLAAASHTATYAIAYNASDKPHTEMDAIRGMLSQIDAISARIHKTTGRAPANFLVCSPMIGAMFSQLGTHYDYRDDIASVTKSSYGPTTSNFGVHRVGSLMNKYLVYEDPFITEGEVLIGLKGATFLDAGYVFAPYIPLEGTDVFTDPNTFRKTMGFMSRFATKVVRPEYYGKLTVSGFPTVTTSI